MVVLGLNLLMGQAGQISLGHAAFVGIGAYGSAIMTTRWSLDPWLAMGVSALLAAAIAGVLGIPTLKLKGHYLAMATLGFGEIVLILLIQFKWLTSGSDGIVGIPSLSLAGLDLGRPKAYHWIAWGVALVMFRMALNLVDSRVGRSLRALHRTEIAAASLGVNTSFRKVQIFVVSAVFASIAGSFYVHYIHFISPDSFAITFSVVLLTTVVIGGVGSVWGAVWGTLLMMFLPEYLKRFNQDYTNLTFGLLMIVIMIFLPGGLVSLGGAFGRARRRSASCRPRTPRGGLMPILSVQGVSKRFGGLEALKDVSFALYEGQVKALIGPNGAGKTTLFNLISGMDRPSEGHIFFRDRDLGRLHPHQASGLGIGRTFQHSKVFDDMTVLDNVKVGRYGSGRAGIFSAFLTLPRHRREEREVREASLAALRRVGLEGAWIEMAGNLPMGDRHLLEIARSLATEPRVLLLDEPAAGLNNEETEQLMGIVRRIRDEGVTILLVEHDMGFVMDISDEVVVLDYGRKIAEGPPLMIQNDEQVIRAYLGDDL